MTTALVLGVAFGLGVFAAYLGLRPARADLEAVLIRLDAPPVAHRAGSATRAERLGRRAAAALDDLGVDHAHLEPDLRLVGRSIDELCAQRLAGGAVGLGVALAPGSLAWAGGLGLPTGAWLAMGVLGAVVGFTAPVAGLRAEAARRRRSFRYAFSAFLDLTAVALSSGAAVEEALVTSARAGTGVAFDEIRQALDGARRSGASPWAALGRLGAELDVAELRELAAALALAGTEGARARESLLAKASTLRRQRLAEAEAEANRRGERARIPLALQFFAFSVLIMAPALFRVASGLA